MDLIGEESVVIGLFKVMEWVLILGIVGSLIMTKLGVKRFKEQKEVDTKKAKQHRGKAIIGGLFTVIMISLLVCVKLGIPQGIILGN